jgi:hypothetical protein
MEDITVYYTLQSSTSILGVYCNNCMKCCSFAYSWPHENVAFWTHSKNQILCPMCAEKYPEKIYRKVIDRHDIPIDRSYFKTDSNFDRQLFHNDSDNKKTHSSRFCTKEEEELELTGTFPVKESICKCPKCRQIITI